MIEHAFVLERLAFLMKTWIVCWREGTVSQLGDDGELNPLYQSCELQDILRDGADRQEEPFIYQDDFQVFFACIRQGDGYYMAGPMATEYIDRAKRHQFYRRFQVEQDLERNLPIHTLTEIFVFVSTLAGVITGREYTDEQLVQANRMRLGERGEERRGQIQYSIREEDEMEYRHSYLEERKMLDMVREGQVDEAVKRSKKLDRDVGKLGTTDIVHWRNMLVIAATLCARAAIEGGVSPYVAYRISGYYINHGMNCKDVHQLMAYKYHMTEEMAKLVYDVRCAHHTSNYVKQCKDYVARHYRQKIYLEDIADSIGISVGYLSRLFKRETGERLQDYIVDVRVENAANLLTFSNEPISRIAEYVNFPSQSYFGRVFKERKHMTPLQYRNRFKPSEFYEAASGTES